MVQSNGREWTSGPVTYSFAKSTYYADYGPGFSSYITQEVYRNAIRQAFTDWGKASGITFKEVEDSATFDNAANIRLGFGNLDPNIGGTVYGTGYPDGANGDANGGVYNGQLIYFQDPTALLYFVRYGDVDTSYGGGYNFYELAAHEIGHALGLNHSDDQSSIMYYLLGGEYENISAGDIKDIKELYPNKLLTANFHVANQSFLKSFEVEGDVYKGPVSGIDHTYINIDTGKLNITALTPNAFIKTGASDDAIQALSGRNVLDGGAGSNFLVGGTGNDTYFVDDRDSYSDIWSTISNIAKGEDATIWGLTEKDFKIDWVDNEGAVGATGLTLHATMKGKPTASVTLSGYDKDDLKNGTLTISYGKTNDYEGTKGSYYLNIHVN